MSRRVGGHHHGVRVCEECADILEQAGFFGSYSCQS
jgi:hypothetical protein